MRKEVSLVLGTLALHSPLITVVLPTCQHAHSLRRSLDAILEQYTTFDTEIVVIDRGSTDDTGDICQEYKALYPSKVRFYTRIAGDFPEKNRVVHLHGDFGIVCRDGELWNDRLKLQRQGSFLLAHSGYDLCFHNVEGSFMPYMRSRDYSPGEVASGRLFRYYSPLFRLSGRPSAHHFSLYERDGEEIFARYSFPGKFRCLENVHSQIAPDGEILDKMVRLPFLRSVSHSPLWGGARVHFEK